MTQKQLEQIDKYHAGRMNEAEMAEFERLLESDPALKTESELQADIINGLKEYRKMELKARLEAINVGPGWMEFVGQSALMKSLGGVMVASLIGAGIYMYGDQPERKTEENTVPEMIVDEPKVESVDQVWKLSEEGDDLAEKVELERPKEMTGEERTPSKEVGMPSTQEESTIEKSTKTFTPNFDTPVVTEVTDETKFQSEGLDELPESASAADADQPIDVETEVNRNKTIKYKYYDGKLFLSGDFDKAPYEILEINSASGRRIYVYYLGVYYQVGITDQLVELPKVRDEEVIKELQLIRENK